MYQPTKDLMTGICNAFPVQQLPWDDYFPRMAETDYYDMVYNSWAAKSFFIRRAPFGGSYALSGGVTAMLASTLRLRFDNDEFRQAMTDLDYRMEFINELSRRGRLRLKIYAPLEGRPIFPNEPAVTAVGPLLDIRLWEGIATEAMNFPTLSLTKWNRLVRAARPGQVLDFSRRRAQNHAKSTLYAMLAGCSATSNSEMRRFFDFKIAASMGHEFPQSRGDVVNAFETWLRYQPRRAFALVDTTQCMEVDFPAWLDAVYAHRESVRNANPVIWGWRNDSGDLVRLTIEQYLVFKRHPLGGIPWFFERMRIILTNDLDEYSVSSMIGQIRVQAGAAGFDAEDILRRIIWAAGTKPGTCEDQPSIGGVAKVVSAFDSASMKLAFGPDGRPGPKTSIPGSNLSALVRDHNGEAKFLLVFPLKRYEIRKDLLYDKQERQFVAAVEGVHPDDTNTRITVSDYVAVQQQKLVYDSIDGEGLTGEWDYPTIDAVQKRVQREVDGLHWATTRLDKPEVMRVMLTPDLFRLRARMIKAGVLREDRL